MGHSMMDLNLLSKTSYETAKSKGWWDSPRSFSALSLLMVSEISEALEDYRAHRGLNEMHYEYSEGGVTRSLSEAELLNLPRGYIVKPCGIPSEVADVCVRIADYAGSQNFDLQKGYNDTACWDNPKRYDPKDFELSLAHAELRISLAFAAWADMEEDLEINLILAWALHPIIETCEANGIELEKAILMKAAYNANRSHRHGNKKI
jgi:hypothetical protein